MILSVQQCLALLVQQAVVALCICVSEQHLPSTTQILWVLTLCICAATVALLPQTHHHMVEQVFCSEAVIYTIAMSGLILLLLGASPCCSRPPLSMLLQTPLSTSGSRPLLCKQVPVWQYKGKCLFAVCANLLQTVQPVANVGRSETGWHAQQRSTCLYTAKQQPSRNHRFCPWANAGTTAPVALLLCLALCVNRCCCCCVLARLQGFIFTL